MVTPSSNDLNSISFKCNYGAHYRLYAPRKARSDDDVGFCNVSTLPILNYLQVQGHWFHHSRLRHTHDICLDMGLYNYVARYVVTALGGYVILKSVALAMAFTADFKLGHYMKIVSVLSQGSVVC